MTMKVQFSYPAGSDSWDETVELPAVPRKGDDVHWGENEDVYVVHTVAWYPQEPSVYVVLRLP